MKPYDTIDSLYGFFPYSGGADRQQYEILNECWQEFPPVIRQAVYELTQSGRFALNPRVYVGPEIGIEDLTAETATNYDGRGRVTNIVIRLPDLTPYVAEEGREAIVHVAFQQLKHEIEHLLDIYPEVMLGERSVQGKEELYGAISLNLPMNGDMIDKGTVSPDSGYHPSEVRPEAAAYGTQVTPSGCPISETKFDYSISHMVGAAVDIVKRLGAEPDVPYQSDEDFLYQHDKFVAGRGQTAHYCCAEIRAALQR